MESVNSSAAPVLVLSSGGGEAWKSDFDRAIGVWSISHRRPGHARWERESNLQCPFGKLSWNSSSAARFLS